MRLVWECETFAGIGLMSESQQEICWADGTDILFYTNDAMLHQADRWSGWILFFTRLQENDIFTLSKSHLSQFLRLFFLINEPLIALGLVTNVLLIVFDLLTSSNWVSRLCWITLGWLSSVVDLTQRFQQFSPEIFLHILRAVALGAASLLVFNRARGVCAHSSPSPVCIAGLRLGKWCVPLRQVTNARSIGQMLHHQDHHIWSEVTEWGSKSRSHLSLILTPFLESVVQTEGTPSKCVGHILRRATGLITLIFIGLHASRDHIHQCISEEPPHVQ